MKLYTVTKEKSPVKGYWLDNGKLYQDNIIIKDYRKTEALKDGIKKLFNKGEKAVFFCIMGRGFCQSKNGAITQYLYKMRLHRKKLHIKEFKMLLQRFGGLTVYKLHDRYIIEVYHN